MAKFTMKPTIPVNVFPARVGAGAGAANNLSDKENNKFVKLIAESRYGLAAAGDQIEGQIVSIESATADGYSMASIASEGMIDVTFDGLQATPGVGVVAIGDYVVVGTVVAKDTALTAAPKVAKATTQTGMYHAWRVVSLGSAGTGAVGTAGVIKRIS